MAICKLQALWGNPVTTVTTSVYLHESAIALQTFHSRSHDFTEAKVKDNFDVTKIRPVTASDSQTRGIA
jgi:hypothetical protein